MKDRWVAVWFSDLETYANDLPRLFHKLALLSRSGQDLFEYFKDLAIKDQVRKASKLGRAAKYFEFKPKVFGISIDIGNILADLAKAASKG
jgi:hypothetical protein